jgi:hypothetical protein
MGRDRIGVVCRDSANYVGTNVSAQGNVRPSFLIDASTVSIDVAGEHTLRPEVRQREMETTYAGEEVYELKAAPRAREAGGFRVLYCRLRHADQA